MMQYYRRKRSVWRRVSLGGSAVAALFVALAVSVAFAASSYTTDFDGLTLGNINGQDGWQMTGPFDVEIVGAVGAPTSFGSQSLRISNATTSGSFGDQLFSASLADEAGESAALNGGLSGGTRQPYFQASWDIASTQPGSEQTGLRVVASPDRGDGARMSFVGFSDKAGGIEIDFYDYVDPTDNATCDGTFNQTIVATGLDRSKTQNIRIAMKFVEGRSNDIVQVYINGVLVHTGTSWEDYFRDGCDPTPLGTRTVDSIIFQTRGTAAPATSGNGFLIDNFAAYSGPVSETTVVVDQSAPDWGFLEEIATGAGDFVTGPGTPPVGTGSAELTVDDTGRMLFGTLNYTGTHLSSINALTYNTYRQSGSASLAPSLQINVDYDLTDADVSWQGRLIYEPYQTGVNPASGVWEEWNTLATDAKWWSSGAPGNTLCPQSSPCTIGEVLTNWPNAGIHATLGGIAFKAGGPWPGGFTGNVDEFTIQVFGDTVHYDFEPCANVVNLRTGENFCTIQAAIDDVDTLDGDTISIAAGAYMEDLNVNKELILQGAGIAAVTIDASGINDYSIDVSADNVTLNGFTLIGNSTHPTAYGIKPSGVSNFTVQNVKVQATSRTGIDLNGVNTALLDNVEVTGVVNGNGISFTDSNDIVAQNITTSGNAWGGLAIYTSGEFYPLGSNNVTIQGANSFGEANKVYTEIGNFADPGNPAPVTNLTVNGFAYTIKNDTDAPNFTFYQITLLEAIAGALLSPTPGDSYVNEIATGDFWVGQNPSVTMTIQTAVDKASPGATINVLAGVYQENAVIDKSLTLTGAGAGTNPTTHTILDGVGLPPASGIQINAGVTDVTIEDLTVQNYVFGSSNHAGIAGAGNNHNFTLQNAQVFNNTNGRGGVYLNGPVDTVLIDNVVAHNNQGRGIVIWNGYKSNITITNNDVRGTNCCGIELQDGTASGVTMSWNTVIGNGDSGMSAIGLTSGAGPNVISNNTVTDNGRFGIEIKNPDGSGLDTGDGSIVVENNVVSFTASATMNIRDHAGIAVFRRSFIPGNPTGYVDVPTGVFVRNNTVTGYVQQNPSATTSEGFGIVIEGVNHEITGNTLQSNEIGLQEQGGNHPNANYVPNDAGDGDQNDGASPKYFGRGNAPLGCGNAISGNTFGGNTTDYRKNAAGSGGGLVENVVTGEFFCSIQAAIDDSETLDGHAIAIGAGVYTEALDVNKELTLQGAGVNDVTIDASTFNDYSIDVTRSNVTLEGFSLIGNSTGSAAYGIKIAGPTPTQISGIIVQNVKVDNSHRTGIDLNGVVGATIDNVEITNVSSGNGIGLSDCSNVIASNITTSNNAWGGIAIYTFGRYFPLGSDNITISGTNSIGEVNKVYVEAGNFSNPANPESVTNLTVTGFEYIVRNDTFRAGGENFTFYQIAQADAVLFALGLPTSGDSYVNELATGEFWVGTDGTNDMMIQAAVDHVGGVNYVPLPTSNTINILAGDYPEEVHVITSVSVRGDSTATTILNPTMDTGSSGDDRAWWLVDPGAVLHISDVTFDGTGYKVFQAIRHKGSGSVNNVAFSNIQYEPSGPAYNGSAIAAFGDGPVDVTNSSFNDIGRIGVLYFGATLDGSLFADNTYTGKGDGDFLDYALDISNGADVTATGNIIAENRGAASVDGSTSAGILLSTFFGPGTGATISGNDISNCSTAVTSGYNDSDSTVSEITGNTFTDNEIGVSVRGATAMTTLKGNSITNTGKTGIGVSINGDASANIGTINAGDSNDISGFETGILVGGTVEVVGNLGSIGNNSVGIKVVDGGTSTITTNDIQNNDTGVLFESGATSTQLFCNNITGNTTGAENQTGSLIQADGNWWGVSDGPNPPGSGDSIIGTFNATPWATSEQDSSCQLPLAVTLGYFHAVRADGMVQFTWQTATESGVAGFELYAETAGERTLLTPAMVPSTVIDAVTPTTYGFSVETQATIFYLNEVGIDGAATLHGPFEEGAVYGQYAPPNDVEAEPSIYLPLVTNQ